MAIELKNICKNFGETHVLDSVNMTIDEGITCVMGASGKGKTTLAYVISGLLQPDSGSIAGRDGKKISFVFQEDRLLEWESAIGNVLFVTKSARLKLDKARCLLTQAGLEGSMHKKAAELSGGMKRRVCLCRALIADHDLLIMDEPFKGLDSETKPKIMSMVQEHSQGDKGKTIIFITHDPAEAEFFGGRLVTL